MLSGSSTSKAPVGGTPRAGNRPTVRCFAAAQGGVPVDDLDATANGATPDDEPLTVFIDGPSGFTFVWDREGRWKFVGKIANESP